MGLTALIVDDEPLAREGLSALLQVDTDVSVIEQARDGREAVSAIRAQRPDLVFLDVQMPEMDGFGVVEEIGAERMPPVVFVTAHDRYAIQAFEINAIDYLLKPVTRERFARALERVKARIHSGSGGDASRQIVALLETLAVPRRYIKRLAIRSGGRTIFVDLEDVDWIQAAQNYVELHARGANHLANVTMNSLEQSLDPEIFLRIHRSIMVNIRRIKEVRTAEHGEFVVVLEGGTRFQSGRTYHDGLKTLITNPF